MSSLHIGNLVFDCLDPEAVADFWVAALGFEKKMSQPDFTFVANSAKVAPNIIFMKVAGEKVVKNRMHMDLHTPNMEAEVERLVGLGAKKVEAHQEYGASWTVMQDPFGNEFCVAQH